MDRDVQDVNLISHEPATEIANDLALPFGCQQPAVGAVQFVQESGARPGSREGYLLDIQDRRQVCFDKGTQRNSLERLGG
jgi:hypothetical protein